MVHLPLVCPHKDKANFCSVAGQLKSVPSAWNLTLDRASGIGGVATLEMMLRLMGQIPIDIRMGRRGGDRAKRSHGQESNWQ